MKQKLQSTIWKYYAYSFFQNMAFFSAVLIPFYTKWGGISVTQIQILQSWYMFWVFILDLPTGIFADKIGRKYSIFLGSLISAIAFAVYGFTPNFYIFMIGEFLVGIGMAFISGAGQALIYDAMKESGQEEESKKILGQADALKYGGMFISSLLGGFIASQFGLNTPMILTAIPLLIAALIALTIKEPQFQEKSLYQTMIEKAKIGFNFLKNNRDLRPLVFDTLAVGASAYFVMWFYQLLLTKINFPINYFGVIYAFLVGTEIIISSNFHFFDRIFGTQRYLKYTALATALSFFIAAVFPNFLTIILFLIFAGGFGTTRQTFMNGHLNQFIPSESRATILSTISVMRRFSLVILNPIAGILADKSLPVALFSIGLISFLPLIYNKKYGTKV